MQLNADDLFQTLSKKSPHLAEMCRSSFLNKDELPGINATENSHSANTSSGAAMPPGISNTYSKRGTYGTASQTQVLPVSSPLYREASFDVIHGAVIRLGFLFGHVIEPDRAHHLSNVLQKARWTQAELDNAETLIPIDTDLARQVGFERTVGPIVFVMARERREVMRGRLLDSHEARKYCAKKYFRLKTVFKVVHVDGVTSPDGRLQPFWLMK